MNKFTDEQYIEAVKESVTWADVHRKLGLSFSGSTYSKLKRLAITLDISTEHMLGQSWSKGKSRPCSHRKQLEEILVENSSYENTHGLKLRLIKEGLKTAECEMCSLSLWNNKPIPLELDHINGIRNDNRFDNLRILCPNCHAQTDTYCSRNKDNKSPSRYLPTPIVEHTDIVFNKCVSCGKECKGVYCSLICYSKNRDRVEHPSKDELEQLLKSNSYVALGKKFGVSDVAVRKWAKKYGIYEPRQHGRNR